MKIVLKIIFLFFIGILFSQCSNQKADGKGKLRLHTMYLRKDDVLNLTAGQTLYFNIDFENRKIAKEHLRLFGFLYRSKNVELSPIRMKYSVSDTVVSENKIFGNYFLKQELVDRIKAMAANGELSDTDHFILKPRVFDDAQRYISYALYIGSDEKVFDLAGSGQIDTYQTSGSNQGKKTSRMIDQLDPSPPAPPQY